MSVKHLAVGEVIRRPVSKCIANAMNSEALDVFRTMELEATVKRDAEGIVQATKKLSLKKLRKLHTGAFSKLNSETSLIQPGVVMSSAHQNFG